MSYFAGMTPVELSFIRVYVAALRRHYSALRTVVDIMNPDNLDIKDFYTASRIATGLEEMHGDFDAALRGIQKKHKLKQHRVATQPTTDDLADLFELSFFKLVLTQKAPKPGSFLVNSHDGWFSGKPEEWSNTLKTCKNLPPAEENLLPDLLSNCFNALAKFFNAHHNFDKKFPPGTTKKIWPVASEADDIEEEDEPGDPFDWLFNDPEDD